MKFTLSWLKDHLETDASLDDIATTLTMIGLEVEEVTDASRALAPFVIAKVISAEQHPNADRLRVCMVDTGAGDPVQVVCGAPNARAGMTGVFAAPGTHVPGTGVDLKVGEIRGVESRGMLLSERELGLSDEHSGIIDLPDDAPKGTPYAAWLGLDDPVIEIAITPNRADCLGVSGVARDLAAAGLGRLKDAPVAPVAGNGPCPVSVTLSFPEGNPICPAFALRKVSGVKNGPSPEWLKRRLMAIGLRPINALVDITNLLTFDRNRPLHVFDAAKVKGDLTVRRAKQGESLLALDGRTYTLDDTMCVIADEAGVESLAGIMGGEETGCSEETTDVLIESALWDPLAIARTGRSLNIVSDARFRFERGIDPAFTLPGLELATALVLELCGGTASEVVLAGEIPADRRTIAFPVAEVARLSGITVPDARIVEILTALGFEVAGSGDTLDVTVPSWRADVEGKADLVEEVVRIVGLDAIPAEPMPRLSSVAHKVLTPMQVRTRLARRTLAARGFVEAITWSFLSAPEAEAFGGGQAELKLANPIASDLSDMRPSQVPGLVRSLQKNADRGMTDQPLFEVGQVFLGDRPEDQKTAATGVRRGTAKPGGAGRHWSGNAGSVDVFDAKADALAVLSAAGAPAERVQVTRDAPAWLHPGRSGTLRLGPIVLGHFGELHPKALEVVDADGPVVAFELHLDAIPAAKSKPTKAKPALSVSDQMPVRRDFAFVVEDAVEAVDILRSARGAEKTLISDVDVFDVYRGKGIEDGKKSVAIEVTLQPRDRTLTDEEIDAVAEKVVAAVSKATGGVLRG
ncbi:phenylalanine--tRNA ligase subunit beta [Amorphus orientalis]|uniref:Phenylalanine--tRNA ligase beta subunit n=1 Tax=Amorphus orientalis TaxID=649198 RepID=A0AAE4AU66_9HYPH|nr:phenylalanine--tRNA ligase subunit beta [Amorphus orientalis]MDQ0317068.1 phenylalanyl-tRNA synthetase beta chain [Amorphus orientalis]